MADPLLRPRPPSVLATFHGVEGPFFRASPGVVPAEWSSARAWGLERQGIPLICIFPARVGSAQQTDPVEKAGTSDGPGGPGARGPKERTRGQVYLGVLLRCLPCPCPSQREVFNNQDTGRGHQPCLLAAVACSSPSSSLFPTYTHDPLTQPAAYLCRSKTETSSCAP